MNGKNFKLASFSAQPRIQKRGFCKSDALDPNVWLSGTPPFVELRARMTSCCVISCGVASRLATISKQLVHHFAFSTSATQRSTIRLRFAPAYSSSIGMIFASFNTAASDASVFTLGCAGTKLIL
jgi:hypothetical protein